MPVSIADGSIGVKPSVDPSAKAVDNDEVNDGSGTLKYRQRVRIVGPDSSTVARKAWSAVSATFLAANGKRRGFMVQNESDETLLLKFGATASAIDYTVAVAPQSPYVCPDGGWTGLVDGIWTNLAGGSGAAQVTELS
jgi:hypothetical protein